MHHNQKPFQLVTFIVLLGMLGTFLPTRVAQAQTASVTLKPAADAYVIETSGSQNFGKETSIRTDGSPVTRSYLRFTVAGLNGAAIQSAKLRIFANSGSATGYTVSKVDNNSWSETAVTFSNAPAVGSAINKMGTFGSSVWTSVDVSAAIKGEGTYSLAVTTSSSTQINLASRESGNSPQLVLTTAATQTAPTAQATTPAAAPTSVATTAPTTPPIDPNSTTDVQPTFPIRAAFYYPWFPEAWNQAGYNPFTNYTPTAGYYDSSVVSIIQKHIKAMTYGNIKAGILSWWGQGSNSDKRVPTILSSTASSSNPNFRWAVYYENESTGNPSQSQIQSDLTYIKNNYSKSPAFLRVNGKFVVFVYSDGSDACGMADRWVGANKALGNPAYVVLKVFSGYLNCGSKPDSWHQYSPAVPTDQQSGYSYAISPGFWLKGQSVRLARDLNRWTANVKSMVASGEKWQLITTFNEWGEGTIVESAGQWTSGSGYGQYMDALHNNGSGISTISQPIAAPTQQATSGTNPTAQPTVKATTAPTQTSGSSDPIIFFTGDLVSGSSMSRAQLVVKQIDNLMAKHPGTPMLVASTGDNEQENNPSLSNYQNYFGTTYGKYVKQGIFMQVRGNHDIQSVGSYTDYNGKTHTSGAAYWNYFGANAHAANISGQKLTDYSFDLGGWHIVGLDQLNGSVNTASLNFLTSDLASNASKKCQIVYWHVPTYSSGAAHGNSTGLKPYNQAEYNAGVDIQLNGHDHHYQRFYPLNPSGQRDDAKGITTFIDGIGGQDGRSGSQTSVAQAASAVYMDAFPGGEAIGVIQFTLHAASADYVTYDANTGGIVDQGTVNCH